MREGRRTLLRPLAVLAACLSGPVGATGLEIDVTGDAQGTIVIDLFEQSAPLHAERITTLVVEGAYDYVVFLFFI